MSKENDNKKNSAIEKVEEISNANTAGVYGAGMNVNYGMGTGMPGGLNGGMGTVPPIIPEWENKPSSAERERMAIEAAHEKEEKKKRKENAEKAREQRKKFKIEKREERLARRDKIKKETEREREKRLIAEKQAEFRRQEERAQRRSAEKERKAKFKEERRKNRQNRGLGGWIASVATLSCMVLILGSLLLFSMYGDKMNQSEDVNSVQAQRAFYDFVGYVDNMETNMSKFFVSSDKEGQQRILGELSVQSNLADMALGELPLQNEAKYKTSKYINQVGDYATYLNKRLIDGDMLTNDDLKRMEDLYKINTDLKKSLTTLSGGLPEDYDFSSLTANIDGDMIIEGFTDMEEQAKDYPEMIYDGPFSDGIEAIKPKGLNFEKVDETVAKEEFKKLFTAYETDNLEVVGKSENSKIETFNVRADIKEGGEVYAQFSVNGGKLVLFNAFRDCSAENYTEDQCLSIAREFLEKAGFTSMTKVWEYSAGNTMHYNFVYEENGILVYPDMVKVNVCRETGRVSGIDADAYFMNHAERKHSENLHSLAEAAEKVNPKLDIVSALAVVIPVGNGNEKEAYEFIATYEGSTYYVYIDALTLKQADLFKVVETDEGTLLI